MQIVTINLLNNHTIVVTIKSIQGGGFRNTLAAQKTKGLDRTAAEHHNGRVTLCCAIKYIHFIQISINDKRYVYVISR